MGKQWTFSDRFKLKMGYFLISWQSDLPHVLRQRIELKTSLRQFRHNLPYQHSCKSDLMPVQEGQLVNAQVCKLLRHRRAESPFNWSFSWGAFFFLFYGKHFQHLARPDLSLNIEFNTEFACLSQAGQKLPAPPSPKIRQNIIFLQVLLIHLLVGKSRAEVTRKRDF